MPKAIAESTLVSALDIVSGRSWSPAETNAIAARLVQLLPQHSEGTTIAVKKIANVHAQRTGYWLLWVGFAIAMSFLSPHHQATTADASISTPQSGATAKLPSVGVDSPSGDEGGQSH